MSVIAVIIGACFVVFLSLGIIIGYLFSSRTKNLMSKIEAVTENVANIPIQAFDKNGKIFLWNKASEYSYGHLHKDAIGKNIAELVLPEAERKAFQQSLDQIIAAGKSTAPHQWTIMTRSGEKRTMYSTMFPYISSGKCEAIFCFDVDITDIKKYEEELDASRQSYQAIFDGVNEAIFVHDPHTGQILDINNKMCEMFEYTREQALKLSVPDISYGDKEKLGEQAKTLIAKAFCEGPQLFEWTAMSKSGRIFTVEVNLKKGVVGRKECILAIVRDISKRKKAEDARGEYEKHYQNLMQNSHDIIFTLGRDGLITTVNQAVKKILGFEKEDVLGKNFMVFLDEEDKQKARVLFAKILQGEQKKREEFKCLTKGKKEIVLLLNAWPLLDEKGKISGVQCIAGDITDRKLVLERMREMVVQTVSMLSETISVADRYTEKHCERLQELSIKTGKKLKLKRKQLENLKYAALLHDVGKVGIPIHILVKKGKLTEEEWQKIKQHPTKGADIVRTLNGFEEIADIVEQHQERVDGKGYPRGLVRDEIRKEAAIIGVVDAFDAMTSDRPYRKALSLEEAIEELKNHAGTQFDPEVVEAFINIIHSEPGNHA